MSAVKTVIGAVIVLLMIGYLFPTAVNAVLGVTTETWEDEAAAVWALFPLLIVLGGLIMIAKPALEGF
jgi:hypothetical protein